MDIVRLLFTWVGVAQAGLITAIGALFDSTTLAALIGGIFLCANTILTILLTKRITDDANKSKREDEDAGRRNTMVTNDDRRRRGNRHRDK